MADLPKFQYQALTHPESQTRVLEIFPGAPEAPLQLGISFVDFDAEEVSEFCALSYTWGEDASVINIEVRLQYDPDSQCVQCGRPYIASGCRLVHPPFEGPLYAISRAQVHIEASPEKAEYSSSQSDYLAELERIFPFRRRFRITRG